MSKDKGLHIVSLGIQVTYLSQETPENSKQFIKHYLAPALLLPESSYSLLFKEN